MEVSLRHCSNRKPQYRQWNPMEILGLSEVVGVGYGKLKSSGKGPLNEVRFCLKEATARSENSLETWTTTQVPTSEKQPSCDQWKQCSRGVGCLNPTNSSPPGTSFWDADLQRNMASMVWLQLSTVTLSSSCPTAQKPPPSPHCLRTKAAFLPTSHGHQETLPTTTPVLTLPQCCQWRGRRLLDSLFIFKATFQISTPSVFHNKHTHLPVSKPKGLNCFMSSTFSLISVLCCCYHLFSPNFLQLSEERTMISGSVVEWRTPSWWGMLGSTMSLHASLKSIWA